MNTPDPVEQILNKFAAFCDSTNREIEYDTSDNIDFDQAKAALDAHYSQQTATAVREACVAELEGIMNCWEHPGLAPYFLTDRIAQLTTDSNKVEGKDEQV